MNLGKIKLDLAITFVAEHPEASLGSLSADGMRRVNGPESLRVAFEQVGGRLTLDASVVPPEECVPCGKGRLGDAIKERLIEETSDTTVCDECQDEIDKLNTMTTGEVIQEAPSLAGRITERAKTKAASIIHRTAARVAPGIVSHKVEGWIKDTARKSAVSVYCGTIADHTTERFTAQSSHISGLELGSQDTTAGRRIISTSGNEEELKQFIEQWNAQPVNEARAGDGHITVVIPCRNHARYLAECIASIRASTVAIAEIIVVDGSSDGNHAQHCAGVTCIRVGYKNQTATRREGFKLVKSRYVSFVDADDKVHPEYFENAISKLGADRLAACAFHDTHAAKAIVEWEDIEVGNVSTSGTVYRTEIIRQAMALDTDSGTGDCGNDLITIRTILRAGPWHAVKTEIQPHTGSDNQEYHMQANHEKEIVTIVIAFSGRWNCWTPLKKWLLTQDWPRDQMRLMILNSSHINLRVADLGLEEWDSNIQIERIDAGYPGLSDTERRNSPDVVRRVEAAVGGLYNRAIQMAYGEWLLFVEDDVIPQQRDTIRKLLANVQPRVACVTGLYQHRYEKKAVAFSRPQPLSLPLLSMEGGRTEKVFGSGFGCLLARRSVLSKYGLAGDTRAAQSYDVGLSIELANTEWEWLLDRSVKCDHLTGVKFDRASQRDNKHPPIAPLRNQQFSQKPWEGDCVRKPWDYRVTVVIPCLDASEAVATIIALYRLQSERPFIVLIDTGSTSTELQALQSLAGDDCEVHSLRLNGVKHPSDFPAIAMDLAMSLCRTEYLLATHADCFPMSRNLVSDVLNLCNKDCPVVGYELTERPHRDWKGMVGHTLTMLHIPTMDRIDAGWSLRRLITQFDHPDGKSAEHQINPATSPNWPDTELLLNYQCRKAGIVPKIIGIERNSRRTVDDKIDHCRSWASAQLYGAQSHYANKSRGWLLDGITTARSRIEEWSHATRSRQGKDVKTLVGNEY